MEGYIIIIVLASLGGIFYYAMRNKKAGINSSLEVSDNKTGNVITQEAHQTFEEKMLFLQRAQNKRLRSIDNTLDWFFWIMIIGFVLTFLNFVMTELNA